MWEPTTLLSASLQVWSCVFHWHPHWLLTHDMHLKTQKYAPTWIRKYFHMHNQGRACTHKSTHKQHLKHANSSESVRHKNLCCWQWNGSLQLHISKARSSHVPLCERNAEKNEGKKTARIDFFFWLMKRKLRQFPRLGNRSRSENARGAFKTTMHHNLQTEPWSLICSCTAIHLHQGCQMMLCSMSLCIFTEWQSRTERLTAWLTVCFQISSLWQHSCRTWIPAWPTPQSHSQRSW